MSGTYFSKLENQEKLSRLGRLAASNGQITVWMKGKDERFTGTVNFFDKDLKELSVELGENNLTLNASALCSFHSNGMLFFGQVIILKTTTSKYLLKFDGDLFKTERRTNYRLLAYPIYEVWAEIDLGEVYQGGKVIDLKSKFSQTNLFKSFLKIVDPNNDHDAQIRNLKLRVQDLSLTGVSLNLGEVESPYFEKDRVFKNIKIKFLDETIIIPEAKVIYVIDYIGQDKFGSKFKVGFNFNEMNEKLTDSLSKKINQLLREVDFNLDFEKFIK